MHKRHKDFILGNPNRKKPSKLFSKENQSNTRTIPIMKIKCYYKNVLSFQKNPERERDNKITPKISSTLSSLVLLEMCAPLER